VPPTRRRPNPSAGQQPPVRRPRVAGLRNRQTTTPRPAADEQVPEAVDATDTTASVEPAEAETTVIDDGVVTGVLGDSAPAEDTTDDEDAEDETTEVEEPPADEPATTRARQRRERRAAGPAPRPNGARPTGKRRSTGVVRPTSREDDAPKAKPAPDTPRRPSPLASRLNVAILLAVIAAVLAGLAFWFRAEANDLGTGQNKALTDTGATTAAIGQLTAIVEDTFSYNYTDLGSTEKAVKAGITGKASCEYEKLFQLVLTNAPTQQLILTTEVRKLALQRLEGDRATALAFIDQTTTKVGAEPLGGGGMLGITAQRIDGHWKIVEFDTFNKTLPNGKEAPSC
jgi:Mce-associated membrane protein